MLKEFGVWCFETGWLITTVLAIPIGYFCGSKGIKYVLLSVIIILGIGFFALYAKHS